MTNHNVLQLREVITFLNCGQEICGEYDDGSYSVLRNAGGWTVTLHDRTNEPLPGIYQCARFEEIFATGEEAGGAVLALPGAIPD